MKLRGMTWDHSRGFLPMVATAQRYGEAHPDVQIVWEKRSLQEFADYPVEKLAATYDLVVIDHPFIGHAARRGLFLPLDLHLDSDFLADQAANSVGPSHASYFWDGHQWALAIDAAAPVSSWRRDLLERAGAAVPQNWEEVLALARRGLVAIPAVPVDALMNFFMFCSNLGEDPFSRPDRVVTAEVGGRALAQLRALTSLCPPEIFGLNPIAIYEAMCSADAIAYCPFAYGYSNYARRGYAPRVLEFGDVPPTGTLAHGRTTLGGAGLAIFSSSRNQQAALDYARYVASPECQRTLYVESGGQPAHRAAWQDEEANRLAGSYFRQTLPTLDRAYLRPRYDGYVEFQDAAGPLVQEYLRAGGDPGTVLSRLEEIFHLTRPGNL